MISKPRKSQRFTFCSLIALLFSVAVGHSQLLPKEVRADQYLLEAQEAFRDGKHSQAVEAFKRIEALDVSMPSEFHFFYGSSLAETDNHDDALKQLSQYLKLEGRDGRHYQDALRKYGKIEQERQALARQQQFTPVRSRLVQFLNSLNSDFRASKFLTDVDSTHYLDITTKLKVTNPENCKIKIDSSVHYVRSWKTNKSARYSKSKDMRKMYEEKIETNEIIDLSSIREIVVKNRSHHFNSVDELSYNYLRIIFRSNRNIELTHKEWIKSHFPHRYSDRRQDESPFLEIPLKEKLSDERISSLNQAFQAWVANCNENE